MTRCKSPPRTITVAAEVGLAHARCGTSRQPWARGTGHQGHNGAHFPALEAKAPRWASDHGRPGGPPPHKAVVAGPPDPCRTVRASLPRPPAGPRQRGIVRARRGDHAARHFIGSSGRRRSASASGGSRAIYLNFFEVLWPYAPRGAGPKRGGEGRPGYCCQPACLIRSSVHHVPGKSAPRASKGL